MTSWLGKIRTPQKYGQSNIYILKIRICQYKYGHVPTHTDEWQAILIQFALPFGSWALYTLGLYLELVMVDSSRVTPQETHVTLMSQESNWIVKDYLALRDWHLTDARRRFTISREAINRGNLHASGIVIAAAARHDICIMSVQMMFNCLGCWVWVCEIEYSAEFIRNAWCGYFESVIYTFCLHFGNCFLLWKYQPAVAKVRGNGKTSCSKS